jgi:outer membrane protein OmpA-like peptidoglycan-associated protein
MLAPSLRLSSRMLPVALTMILAASGVMAQQTDSSPTASQSSSQNSAGQSDQQAGRQAPATGPQAPASTGGSTASEEQPSKFDLFLGYSYLSPNGRVNGQQLRGMPWGGTISPSFWLNRYFGLAVEGGHSQGPNATISTLTAGPTFRIPLEGLTPFGLATFGANRLNPGGLPARIGFGFVGGGGFDLSAGKRLAIRIIEAEYVYGHQSFFPQATVAPVRTNLGSAKISGGLVFKFGSVGPPPVPPSMSCSANPTEVFAGEPVTVTANAQNFNPKRTITYSWTTTGGKVSGNAATTQVDTNGLNPGSYTVSGHATDGKKGTADCTATFAVKQPRAPTISCSANPTTVKPGDQVTVTCQASSPDNRPLTYAYKSSAGNVSGTGPTAQLSTQGAQPGPITITGTATDDRGLTASSDTTVTVEAPPPPPPPPPPPAQAAKINQIEFPNKVKPWRVDNTAKAILDDVALRMQREPDSKLVILGNIDPSDPAESKRRNLSAERAVDTKFYLTNDKGIDPSRIETRSGGTGGKTAEMFIVPAGATYSGAGTVVDENKIKPIPDHPAPKARARRGARRGAATPR